ncbi:MAG: hypothetical protein AAF206_12070 [Bacteroidota bacterium]
MKSIEVTAIEINWQEQDLVKRHYAEHVLHQALSRKQLGYCDGGGMALKHPLMTTFFFVQSHLIRQARRILEAQLKLEGRYLAGYQILQGSRQWIPCEQFKHNLLPIQAQS